MEQQVSLSLLIRDRNRQTSDFHVAPRSFAAGIRMIEEGKPKDEILAECAKAEDVDDDVLNSVEPTIDYLLRQ